MKQTFSCGFYHGDAVRDCALLRNTLRTGRNNMLLGREGPLQLSMLCAGVDAWKTSDQRGSGQDLWPLINICVRKRCADSLKQAYLVRRFVLLLRIEPMMH